MKPFQQKPGFVANDRVRAKKIKASPAIDADGHPAVFFRAAGQYFVLREAEALTVANAIADALEHSDPYTTNPVRNT